MKQEKDSIKHIEILTLENFFGEGSSLETVHRVISNMLPTVNNMPGIFRQSMEVAPSRLQLQTFFQVLPMLGTYATRVRFSYVFDSTPQAFLFQSYLKGDQASGKSFVRNLYNIIMGPILRHDEKEMRIEQEYMALKARSRKNEKLPPEPKTIVFCLPPTVSNTKLLKRADAPVRIFGAPLTLFIFSEEIALASESNKRAFSNWRTMSRTGFDLGSTIGQDYLSETSYSALNVDLMLNMAMCGTPSSIETYFDKSGLEGGNASRSIINDLNAQIGDEPPVFKPFSEKQLKAVNELLEKLFATIFKPDGEGIQDEIYIDMSWLYPDVKRWCAAKNAESVTSGSYALATFYKRASLIAFRVAALCQFIYILEGKKSYRKYVRQIYYASAEYILYGQLREFGERLEQLRKTQSAAPKLKKNLFNSMGDTFTKDDLDKTLQVNEMTSPANVLISQWLKRGFIERTAKDNYRKIKK